MRPLVVLAILLLSYLGFAIAFNQATPYRTAGQIPSQNLKEASDIGAPDERQHANYVRHLQQGKGFGVLDPKDPNLGENYQFHQPPLYYLLAAGWSSALGLDPTDQADGFGLRLLNTFFGFGTVLAAFYAGRWGLGRDEVGLAAAAFVALLPMNLALHSAVSNDPLLFLFLSWSLALLLRAMAQGWDLRLAAGLGGLLGLALLTKTSALGLFPAVFLGLAWATWKGPHRPGAAVWGLCLGLPFLVAGFWIARNLQLYGDPFAISAFRASFTGSAQAGDFIERLGPWKYWVEAWGVLTLSSLIGVFGYMDIALDAPFYQLAWFVILLGAAGWVLSLGEKPSEDQPDPRPVHLVNLAFVGVVGLLFLQFNLTYFQAQGRYLLPAIVAMGLGLGIGFSALLRERREWAWLVVAVPFAVLSFLSWQTLVDQFPPRILR